MQIWIKTLTGRKSNFDFNLDSTVLDVKHALQEKEGIQADQIRLIFSGKQLADDKRLEEYGVNAGAVGLDGIVPLPVQLRMERSSIHGTHAVNLVETIIRQRVFECGFWKQQCFGLTAALLVDKATELKSIGGVLSDNNKPTDFLCLLVKMLQMQPEIEIVMEFIRSEDYKYLRALGAMYLRLTCNAFQIYSSLEPLYSDYRKLRIQSRSGCSLICVDEFIDSLLYEDRVCDIALPRMAKRKVLENTQGLLARVSPLQAELDGDQSDLSSLSDEHESPIAEEPKRKRIESPSEKQIETSDKKSKKKQKKHKKTEKKSKRPRLFIKGLKSNLVEESSEIAVVQEMKPHASSGNEINLTNVEEQNRIRVSLGLPLLR